MDLLGGTLGILFARGFLQSVRPGRRRVGVILLSAILAAGAVLFALGRLLLYEQKGNSYYWIALSRLPPKGFWFFDETWGPRTIHSMTPLEGIALILLTLGAYSIFDRRPEVRGR